MQAAVLTHCDGHYAIRYAMSLVTCSARVACSVAQHQGRKASRVYAACTHTLVLFVLPSRSWMSHRVRIASTIPNNASSRTWLDTLQVASQHKSRIPRMIAMNTPNSTGSGCGNTYKCTKSEHTLSQRLQARHSIALASEDLKQAVWTRRQRGMLYDALLKSPCHLAHDQDTSESPIPSISCC